MQSRNPQPNEREPVHEPFSPEAKEALWAAYQALGENNKRTIVKTIAQEKPSLFEHWAKAAHLPGGFDKRKVLAREKDYGIRLDKALKEHEEGYFGTDVLLRFLDSMGLLIKLARELPENLSNEELNNRLDMVLNNDSPFESLAALFFKCLKKEAGSKPNTVLKIEKRLTELANNLDSYGKRLEDWAQCVRLAVAVPVDGISETIEKANKDSEELIDKFSELGKITDLNLTCDSFKSHEDIKSHICSLIDALASRQKRDQLAHFLEELADSLRRLCIVHRSTKENQRIIGIRDQSLDEVDHAASSENPKWNTKVTETGNSWLDWAFQLDGEDLDRIQSCLDNDGYSNLAILIGLGDTNWIVDNDTENEQQGSARDISDQLDFGTTTTESRLYNNDLEIQTSRAETIEPIEEQGVTAEVPEISGTNKTEDDHTPQNAEINASDNLSEPAPIHPPLTIKSTKVEALDESVKKLTTENDTIRTWWKEVLEDKKEVKPEVINALTVKLALEKGFGLALAYQFSKAFTVLGKPGRFPSWIWGAAAGGSALAMTDQTAITILRDNFYHHFQSSLFDHLNETEKESVRLLIAAGAMKAALFFPISDAIGVLQELKIHKLPSFQLLLAGIIDYGSRGFGLPRAAIFSSISDEDFHKKLNDIQEKAKEWLRGRAPRFDIISHPGKETWRVLIGKDGLLGKLLRPVIDGQVDAAQDVQDLVNRFSSPLVIDQEAQNHFRRLQHRGGLIVPALKVIRRHTLEAINLAQEWLDIVGARPNTRQDFNQKILDTLRRCFRENGPAATRELSEIKETSFGNLLYIGADVCLRSVGDITNILEGSAEESSAGSTRSLLHILHEDLLRIPKLPLDNALHPRPLQYSQITDSEDKVIAKTTIRCIAEQMMEGVLSFEAAFKARSELGDHESTEEILKVIEAIGGPECLDNLKKWEHERKQDCSRHRESIKKKLILTQKSLSDALTKGLLDSVEYDRWYILLAKADIDIKNEGFYRFIDVYALCDELSAVLRNRNIQEVERLYQEINKREISLPQKQRLDSVLATGDVHTATDYLDRINNHIELPEVKDNEGYIFKRFFSGQTDSACELIEKELKDAKKTIPEILSKIKHRDEFCGLDLKDMQSTQAHEAADFIRLWFQTKSAFKLSEEAVIKIFKYFGMIPRKVGRSHNTKGIASQSEIWDLQIEKLDARDIRANARFGSDANGSYKVLGYWNRPAVEDILQTIRMISIEGPFIVLFFGRISSKDRRQLAEETATIHRRSNMILIDDILAIYIAGQRKSRLQTMFLCTLPFTHINPYTKAASLLPPEMFFGRKGEILKLISTGTDSSCLLYGGRQIGKTVLLRHVLRIFEKERPDVHVSIYIDLKGKEIGTNRSMDEIWIVIADELEKRKVIDGPVSRQTRHDWLFPRIKKWLQAESRRRILILLDEADAFLSADAKGDETKKPFSSCTVLKDLMEETNRRFKLVFAGLHNVQKSTKVSNNPLAHFGESICIGAMTGAGESREAEALITEPMETAGYFFESPDLPSRILAQTNYYPNLIQIYCDVLLKYMQQRSRALFDHNTTPPYIVTAKILEDVYEQHELREELRLRFKWTLELDRRFELIANILAFNDIDCSTGLELLQIRKEALVYWENGFSGKDGTPISYESFKDLLEEMVGLGILRRADHPDHYALRNPNVLTLIGSRSAMEKLLEDAHKWETLDAYDPTKFRGQMSEKDKALRSPLNAAQEQKLKSGSNQVCIICGCKAGQVDRIEEAINHRFGRDGYVRPLKGYEDLDQFKRELSRLSNRKSQGTTLIVVPDMVPWNRDWIHEALKKIRQWKEVKGAVCIVFIAQPMHLWPLIPEIANRQLDGVCFLTVEPWDDTTVNLWLQESGRKAIDAESRAKLADATGNWPLLLERAVDLMGTYNDPQMALNEYKRTEFTLEKKKELFDFFGLNDTIVEPLRFLAREGSGWSETEVRELLVDSRQYSTPDHVNHVFAWAELFALIKCGASGLVLDVAVQQALTIE